MLHWKSDVYLFKPYRTCKQALGPALVTRFQVTWDIGEAALLSVDERRTLRSETIFKNKKRSQNI